MALTYGQEENLRIDCKIQMSSESVDVDASSGRTWTVNSFEKNKQIYQRFWKKSRIVTREVATEMGISYEKQSSTRNG
jgi:hypothetical protein